MENNQNNPERYIITGGEKVAVTEELYREYIRPIWAENKRNERKKRCRTKKGNRCTDNCSECQHTHSGTPVSLDVLAEMSQEPAVQGADPEDVFVKQALYQALHTAIDNLEPRKGMIVRMLIFQGMTERQVAAKVGLTQKGVNYSYHKALAELKEFMKDWR